MGNPAQFKSVGVVNPDSVDGNPAVCEAAGGIA